MVKKFVNTINYQGEHKSLRRRKRLSSPHWRKRSTSLFLKATWDEQDPNFKTWQPGSCCFNTHSTSYTTSSRSAYLAVSSSTCESRKKFFIKQPSRLVNGFLISDGLIPISKSSDSLQKNWDLVSAIKCSSLKYLELCFRTETRQILPF